MTDRIQRLTRPPRSDNVALDRWLQQATDALNDLPLISYFSGDSPESSVTGQPGEILVNENSNHSLLWYKESGVGQTGWVSLATERSA